MFVRRFYLHEITKCRILQEIQFTKYYFKPGHDIFYFTFKESECVRYGLMVENWPMHSIELDAKTFQILNTDVIATLTKTVYIMPIEDRTELPINVFEVHSYNDRKLIVAEVKFETLKLKKKFVPPDWFGKEIVETHFDFLLVFPIIAEAESFDQVAPMLERDALLKEAEKAEQDRYIRLGSFEDRLIKVRHKHRRRT